MYLQVVASRNSPHHFNPRAFLSNLPPLAAALGLLLATGSSSSAAILHRWSFTETSGAVIDSIGSANGSVILLGTNSFRTNGVITLSGGGRTTNDYVQLPAGLVHSLTNVTVELWATPNAGQTWSRLFDFGPGNNTQAGTFYLSLCRGSTSLNQQRFEYNSPSTWTVDTGVSTTAGTQYHYVVTWSANGATTGGGVARWYRNGVLDGSTNTGAVNITNVNDTVLWLGRSQYGGDNTASATYNEVRIYSHAMGQTEINADLANGPDVLVIPPTQVTGLIASPGAGSGTLVLTWTPGSGSAGTLVAVRTNQFAGTDPSYGNTYTASATFGNGQNLGSNNFVVYTGSGGTVTVSNLTPGVTYYATAYSYSGGGAVYNLQDPPTVSQPAPGTVQSISLQAPAQIAYGATGQATVTANYSGGVQSDVTAYASFSSSASGVVSVSSGGQLQAVGFGSSLITAAYQGFQSTQTVAVANPLTSNLTHRYSFTTDASDSIGTANGSLQGNAAISSGTVVLDGVNSYVALPADLVTNYPAITLEAWVTDNGSGAWARIWDFGSSTTAYMFLALPAGGGNLRGAYTTNGNGSEQVLQWAGTGRPPVGQEAHIVWTTDSAAHQGILYVNGVPVATNAAMTLSPASLGSTPNDWLGRSQFGGDPYFNGSIDEFRIYNIAISPALVQLNFQNGPDGLQLPPNPRLPIASPTNVVFAGTTVTLTASVGGLPPYQYQWESNGVAIASATNSTLVLSNTTVSFSAGYDVVVANIYGTNRSPVLSLTVLPPAAPSFTQQPAPAAVTNYVGGFVTFTAVVAGSQPMSLQWAHNGTNVPAATASVLTLPSLQLGASGNYTLIASNAFGMSNSAPAVLTVLPLPGSARPSVLTYHYDNTRRAENTNEVLLTLSSVNTNTFGKLFSYSVDGYVYTEPLIMTNLTIPGQGVHNVVLIATEHDTVYAFDADSNQGTNGGLLWQTNLGISAVSSSAPFGYRYTGGGYTDILPEVGATGTPVIDPVTGTLYVNAFTHEGANFIHRIHALDVTTGAERPYSPVVVAGSVPGTGFGSVGGVMTFSAVQHNQRPALTLANGILYVGYAGYADTDPYHGWLFGFNATNLVLLTNYVYNTTPNASTNVFGAHAAEGGIWQGGGGLCVDASSNIYFMTGNGSFTANTNGGDYSDSFLKLSTTGNQFSVADYFTPYNQANLAAGDTDLGSSGPILLPDDAGSVAHPHLIAGSGKQGTLYLVDRDNMGHYQAGSDSQIVQSVIGANGGVWSPPAYFNHLIFFQASGGTMNSFVVTNGALGTSAASRSSVSFGSFNGGPVVSANGTRDAIAWVINSAAYNSSGPGVLYAYNATNLSQQLYNSSQLLSRDNPGGAVKMTTPTVAGGKVYVGTEYTLSVYGLEVFLSAPFISPPGGAFTNSVIISMSDSSPGASIYYTLDGTAPTASSTLYTGSFVLTSNAVVQAIAIKSGAVSSPINSASFVNTAELGNGTGLLGQYYPNTFPTNPFTGSPLVRTDAVVNFNWSGVSPAPGIPPTNYTVLWTGSVQPQFTELYTFYTTADDGVRLYINGQLLIDDWVDKAAPTTHSNTIALAAQQLYSLRMEYYQHTNTAAAILSWSSASAPFGVIPQTQLYPYTNPPPSVAILSPTNGSAYTATASVTINADADAPYNPLAKVDFYANGSLLGTPTNLPYTLTTTGLAAGGYSLTAVATDGSGLSATSAPVSITVNSGSGLPYGLTARGVSPAFYNMPSTSSGSLPALLSQTGVFGDTPTMTPAAGLIPYSPNTPLWSDGALKTRYLSVPYDGGAIRAGEQIAFAPTGAWTFPAGTVFVKTFELNTDLTNPNVRHRLETRLLIRDINGQVYGVTYKWRPDNSDADLLGSSLSENILITNASGLSTQTWYYPSPSDCLTCHTPVANYVLGVSTRQLNGNQTYSTTGVTDNQIRTLNRLGVLNPAINESAISGYEKLSALTNLSASFEDRARSYLDANCAQCHQPGGTGITFDARYETPLANQNITNYPAAFSLGYDRAEIIKPKDVWRSVIYDRMNTVDTSNSLAKIQMPPLARNLIDSNAVAVMASWINSLPGTQALAPPTLSPDGGSFIGSVSVSLQPPDGNAAIYYTLDGSLPTTSSSRYSGPIQLMGNATLAANAFETNYDNSVAVSAVFLVQPLRVTAESFSNQVFQLTFIGAPGSNYVLQASTNFVNWTALATNPAPAGLINFTDPNAGNYPYRFYRVLLQ